MSKMTSIAFAAIAFTAAAGTAGAAEPVAWSSPAAGCAIAEGRDLAEVAGATVRFAAGKTGAIRVVCPITDARFGLAGTDTTNLGGMNIHYQDSTGTDSSAIVAAELFKTPIFTGVSASMGIFKSDVVSITQSSTVGVNVVPAGFQFDFSANVYHVEITLKRSSADKVVSITAITLRKLFPRAAPV